MEDHLTLRIILEKPPLGVDFALQKGRGSNYETVQEQGSTGRDLSFKVSVSLKLRVEGAPPVFLGPFVQGPPEERFIYIDIGKYAGQVDSCWSRRLKVPLRGIDWKMIEGLPATAVLEARVPGTGKDGGPSCATVKPFAGWRIARR